MKIDIVQLKAEMLVAKNCLIKINKNFDLPDLKKAIEKNVYPNVFKLLKVIF